MFKKDFYTEVIRVLNLNTNDVIFKGGYLIGVFNRTPTVVDQTSTEKFDYTVEEVIPLSEEYFKETPSVNLADRSDYVVQYSMMFKSNREDEVLTALDEFNTYWKTNKQVTIDGYTVGVKAGRGDKTPNLMTQTGYFYSFYSITIYLTAIKNGYIWKDTDKWEMKLSTATEYDTLKFNTETFSNSGNPLFSNKAEKATAKISTTTSNSAMVIFYNEQPVEDSIYSWIMNKLDKDTIFDIKHTFNGDTFTYRAHISTGSRTRTDNGVLLLTFNWVEADE